MIDRQVALRALEEIEYALWEIDIPSPTVPEYVEHHEQVQKVMQLVDKWARKLIAMPNADQRVESVGMHWIPCSEGLPKKDGRYQVTRYDYNTEFIDILWYEENLWWNRRYTGDYAVTAWMPLPEPYKEEACESR